MKVVFLDRDGTIIYDPSDERIDSVDKIKLFPDTIKALKYLSDHGYSVIFITDQAGIAEGRITENEFWHIHKEVLKKLAPSGIKVLKTYMNGEAQSVVSEWRKPGPKMLLQAAKDFGLDLKQSYMVGDRQSDIMAGVNAGCKGSILVKTATNKEVESKEAIFTANTLWEAVTYIVEN